ncbi:MAG: hypothetical protein R3B06_23865 [Kofleriaceae bacterium]
MRVRSVFLGLLFATAACSDDSPPADPEVVFDLDAELTGAQFFDAPFPSDVRIDADGTQAYAGFPGPGNPAIIRELVAMSEAKHGASTMPVAYFRFRDALPTFRATDVIAADPASPILLVDVDPASPERGRLVPVVAQSLFPDGYAVPYLLAVAPRPGFVLRPSTTYAAVVRTSAAPDRARPAAIVALASGKVPTGARGAATATAYAPLWTTLTMIGVPADDVLTATVFTTGDQAALLYARSEQVRTTYDAVITNLRVNPDGGVHTADPAVAYCELIGEVALPQFQTGTPPFLGGGGDIQFDASGAPIKQGDATVPVTITIPAGPMPADGWPLYQFFHGSGGVSSGLVDLGKTLVPDGEPVRGEGPGYVVARYGIAAVSAALPVNPERVPGASDYAYLNLQNLTAFPGTFQQGIYEQRLLLDAMLDLQIPAAVLAPCRGADATVHHFDGAKLVAGGQSMGGMYTNLYGAVEPRVPVLVPTGAGGFWSMMILQTGIVGGARGLLATLLQTEETELTFMHPGLAALGTAWEIAEPGAAMARLGRYPLPGHPVHHVYEPVGKDDVYFPIPVYDAAALANGNRQAGDETWPSMQPALALDGLDGLAPYPVQRNVRGPDGADYTRVVVQYEGDGIVDPHYLYRQLDAVKHQYACFFDTYLRTGTPVVVAPGPLTAPCQ